jgi:hypothetical protein
VPRVLEVVIHQDKEIPIPAKSCSTYVQVVVHDQSDILKINAIKRTNAPIWEHKIRLFILDADRAKLKFALMMIKTVEFFEEMQRARSVFTCKGLE